jgi:hypothetical protein
MLSLRDILIFAAGAQSFHAFSHLILPFVLNLPLEVSFFGFRFQFTRRCSLWTTALNVALAALLIWIAARQ